MPFSTHFASRTIIDQTPLAQAKLTSTEGRRLFFKPCLQALIATNGIAYVPPSTDPDLTNAEAAQIAQALVNRTTSSNLGSGPLNNVADLVGRYTAGFSNANGQPFDGFSADVGACYSATGPNSPAYPIVQRFRESAIRDLADAGQAGAWNLLIDLIVQTGRYPTTRLAFRTSSSKENAITGCMSH